MKKPTVDGEPAIFHFVMIKPTHYDDDGYPIQWFRSAIPVQHAGLSQRLGGGRQAPRGAGNRRRYPAAHLR